MLICGQLCICAIPVFFKLPGMENLDLGSRTEGEATLALSSFQSNAEVRFCHQPAPPTFIIGCVALACF